MTRDEERELWWRAREVLTQPNPARHQKAWDAIWNLVRVAKDPTVHARALAMVEEVDGCEYLQNKDRTDIVAVRPAATFCRLPVAQAAAQ